MTLCSIMFNYTRKNKLAKINEIDTKEIMNFQVLIYFI